jgi:hypothetical protein
VAAIPGIGDRITEYLTVWFACRYHHSAKRSLTHYRNGTSQTPNHPAAASFVTIGMAVDRFIRSCPSIDSSTSISSSLLRTRPCQLNISLHDTSSVTRSYHECRAVKCPSGHRPQHRPQETSTASCTRIKLTLPDLPQLTSLSASE